MEPDPCLNEFGPNMTSSRIAADPTVMLGKPCIKGMRLTAELILRKLGAGRSFADLLEAYPQLRLADVFAALIFAADYCGTRPFLPSSDALPSG